MIPETMNILGSTWRIEILDKVTDPDTGEELDGFCNDQKRTLELSKSCPRGLAYVFGHELSHAICEEVGLHHVEDWSATSDELFAHAVGKIFEQNFKNIFSKNETSQIS